MVTNPPTLHASPVMVTHNDEAASSPALLAGHCWTRFGPLHRSNRVLPFDPDQLDPAIPTTPHLTFTAPHSLPHHRLDLAVGDSSASDAALPSVKATASTSSLHQAQAVTRHLALLGALRHSIKSLRGPSGTADKHAAARQGAGQEAEGAAISSPQQQQRGHARQASKPRRCFFLCKLLKWKTTSSPPPPGPLQTSQPPPSSASSGSSGYVVKSVIVGTNKYSPWSLAMSNWVAPQVFPGDYLGEANRLGPTQCSAES